MADRLGWTRTGDGDLAFEWDVPGTDTSVAWERDPDTHVEYFAVVGPDRDRVAAEIADAIDLLGVDDFESHVARSTSVNWMIPALYQVATAAPLAYDPRVAALMDRYMDSSDLLIRRVAILAASFTGWPEFVEPIRRFLSDPDVDVRVAAEAALRDLSDELTR
ncbi:hypothetical protein GCM10029964_040150 [Kibdelosporangium lantanae]